MISQLLSPFGRPPRLWGVSCELEESLSIQEERAKTTWCYSIHWAFTVTMRPINAGWNAPENVEPNQSLMA